eukprot:3170587-Rhodomonas_salina.4
MLLPGTLNGAVVCSLDVTGISLRACCAISGTDLACHATDLRAPYGISGSDIAYYATSLRARYAMSGTDLAYHATRA